MKKIRSTSKTPFLFRSANAASLKYFPVLNKIIPFSALCMLLSALPLSAAPQILLSSSSVFPGETLRVEVDGLNPSQISRLVFAKGTYQFFGIGSDAQRALVGIRLDAAPGKYPLKLQRRIAHPLHWESIAESSVDISSRVFPTEDIHLPDDKVALSRNMNMMKRSCFIKSCAR